MATKKKAPAASDAAKTTGDTADSTINPQQEAYEALVGQFAAAVEAFNNGELSDAKTRFDAITASGVDEPVMIDRSRSYSQICARRLAPTTKEPGTAEERYYRAVLLINQGQGKEALLLLDQALQEAPTSAKYLYARASAWAVEGNVDKAVSDLRQAISVDPQIRFQAVNDPDFQPIREEPAFIDIIEPTPSGV
jgi:tetratricopeptide (TPR) repeat protein